MTGWPTRSLLVLIEVPGTKAAHAGCPCAVPLVAHLALGLEALRPGNGQAVARAALVRGDLLGPLVRAVHGLRPADRVVFVIA